MVNLIPPQRAGAIAVSTGLATANGRWCEVDFPTMASRVAPEIHVLGDAVQIAPLMPKSGTMANQHGKVAAAAILQLLAGQAPDPTPLVYKHLLQLHVRRRGHPHRQRPSLRSGRTDDGHGDRLRRVIHSARTLLEGRYAWAWARSIWSDMLGEVLVG